MNTRKINRISWSAHRPHLSGKGATRLKKVTCFISVLSPCWSLFQVTVTVTTVRPTVDGVDSDSSGLGGAGRRGGVTNVIRCIIHISV